jgi:hypothetical protein
MPYSVGLGSHQVYVWVAMLRPERVTGAGMNSTREASAVAQMNVKCLKFDGPEVLRKTGGGGGGGGGGRAVLMK